MTISRGIVFIVLMGFAMIAAATEQSLRPGGIAIVDIASSSETAPVATYDGKRVMVIPRADRWVAILGVPLSAKPGERPLTAGGVLLVVGQRVLQPADWLADGCGLAAGWLTISVRHVRHH